MTPVGLELKIICPFCQHLGTLEPDIVFAGQEENRPMLSGLLVRDCACQRCPRFKVNLDHGVWQVV